MTSQERRLMRRMAHAQNHGQRELATMRGGLVGPDPEYVREQQDRDRTRLAEQVLLEMVEGLEWQAEEDTEAADTAAAERCLRVAARASLAAAEVVYPEVPSDEALQRTAVELMTAADWARGAGPGHPEDLPLAAQEGAQGVGGFPAEPRPTIAELEARLNRGGPVGIDPDGTIRGEG